MALQDNYVKTALRIPQDLHEAIKAEAERRNMSMNDEMIRRLHGGLDEATRAKVAELMRVIDDHEKHTEEMNVLLAEHMENLKSRSALVAEYKNVLSDIATEMVKFFEKNDRSPDDDKAMMLQLLRVLANLRNHTE